MRSSVFIFFLHFCCVFGAYTDELCQIDMVTDLVLFSYNNTLSWSSPPVSNLTPCEISYYLVKVENEDLSLIFTAYSTELDVSNLPNCEWFNFTVSAISGMYEGKSNFILAKTSAPKEETFDIIFTNVTENDNNIELFWSLADGQDNCISHYRLSYWDESHITPKDIQVHHNRYILHNVSSCTEYKFEVRGILDNLTEGPANYTNITTSAKTPSVPVLVDVAEYSTSIDLSWEILDSIGNKCQPEVMFVDAAPLYNATFVIDVKENEFFNITLDNLEPDTAYITQVYVVNDAGASNPLHLILQTASNETINF